MNLKEGAWKGKTTNVYYVVTERYAWYELYCIQSKKTHYLEKDKIRLFLENHMFMYGLQEVYDRAIRH